ncbi:MAG: hypothetical protein HRU15_07045 [Planctomycetes bacterium]|nr:hypothetical protein [Planctomycetota bacterium]
MLSACGSDNTISSEESSQKVKDSTSIKNLSPRAYHQTLSGAVRGVGKSVESVLKVMTNGHIETMIKRQKHAITQIESYIITLEDIEIPEFEYANELYNEANALFAFYEDIIYDDFTAAIDIYDDDSLSKGEKNKAARKLARELIAAEKEILEPVQETENVYCEFHGILLKKEYPLYQY